MACTTVLYVRFNASKGKAGVRGQSLLEFLSSARTDRPKHAKRSLDTLNRRFPDFFNSCWSDEEGNVCIESGQIAAFVALRERGPSPFNSQLKRLQDHLTRVDEDPKSLKDCELVWMWSSVDEKTTQSSKALEGHYNLLSKALEEKTAYCTHLEEQLSNASKLSEERLWKVCGEKIDRYCAQVEERVTNVLKNKTIGYSIKLDERFQGLSKEVTETGLAMEKRFSELSTEVMGAVTEGKCIPDPEFIQQIGLLTLLLNQASEIYNVKLMNDPINKDSYQQEYRKTIQKIESRFTPYTKQLDIATILREQGHCGWRDAEVIRNAEAYLVECGVKAKGPVFSAEDELLVSKYIETFVRQGSAKRCNRGV